MKKKDRSFQTYLLAGIIVLFFVLLGTLIYGIYDGKENKEICFSKGYDGTTSYSTEGFVLCFNYVHPPLFTSDEKGRVYVLVNMTR